MCVAAQGGHDLLQADDPATTVCPDTARQVSSTGKPSRSLGRDTDRPGQAQICERAVLARVRRRARYGGLSGLAPAAPLLSVPLSNTAVDYGSYAARVSGREQIPTRARATQTASDVLVRASTKFFEVSAPGRRENDMPEIPRDRVLMCSVEHVFGDWDRSTLPVRRAGKLIVVATPLMLA